MHMDRLSGPTLARIRRSFAWLAPLAPLIALSATYSCSLLIENRSQQCESDTDCGSGFKCDAAQHVCLGGAGGAGGATTTSTTSTSTTTTTGAGGATTTTTTGAGGTGGNMGDPCDVPENQKPVVEVTGDITSDFVLGCENVYLLKGETLVTDGATLTIKPGTLIKGFFDAVTPSVLVIQPGGKLIAVGTADKPIVFTSELPQNQRKPGDWGGVILLGKAPVNILDGNMMPTQGKIEGIKSGGLYGGNDPNDSSGILKYVRIEYSGVLIAPNNEVNGLTLGAVGRGTVIDYVQVRHTADDCFEFFGGTVNAKHLVCAYNGDDGFDWDNGYQGKLQFLALQQDPAVADETNGFEGDNDANKSLNAPLSEPTIYNATLCGKNAEVNQQQYGLLLRRSTKGHIFNAIFTGFEAGLDLRDPATSVEIQSSIFFGNLVANQAYAEIPGGAGVFADDDSGVDEILFLDTPAWKNATIDPGIPGCFDPKMPVFGPATSLTVNAATPPNDGFFDVTANFIGAFRDVSDTWATTGNWVVWSNQ